MKTWELFALDRSLKTGGYNKASENLQSLKTPPHYCVYMLYDAAQSHVAAGFQSLPPCTEDVC